MSELPDRRSANAIRRLRAAGNRVSRIATAPRRPQQTSQKAHPYALGAAVEDGALGCGSPIAPIRKPAPLPVQTPPTCAHPLTCCCGLRPATTSWFTATSPFYWTAIQSLFRARNTRRRCSSSESDIASDSVTQRTRGKSRCQTKPVERGLGVRLASRNIPLFVRTLPENLATASEWRSLLPCKQYTSIGFHRFSTPLLPKQVKEFVGTCGNLERLIALN